MYAEYDYVNHAGSFLYEPAGSEHTLTVFDENTEPTDVWFPDLRFEPQPRHRGQRRVDHRRRRNPRRIHGHVRGSGPGPPQCSYMSGVLT